MTVSLESIFAGLAFLLSCYATFVTVRFNQRQKALIESQEQLNAMLLKQGQQEASNAGRADLGATFVKLGSTKVRLKIWNKGKATARNVRIEIADADDIFIPSEIDEKFPLETLEQHQFVELIASPHMGSKLKHAVRLMWEDDHSLDNDKTVYPTL